MIKTVTIPKDEYLRLKAIEADMADLISAADVLARIKAGTEELIPSAVIDRLLAGDAPLTVWRTHRGLPQAELARQSGVNRIQIIDIEAGHLENFTDQGRQPQRRAPISLWVTIWANVPSDSTSARDGLIGVAQSQASRSRLGSIAHPAVKTALKISAIGVLHLIGHLLRCLQGSDPGIGPTDHEFGLGLQTAAPKRDQKRGANRECDRSPKGGLTANPRQQGGQDCSHSSPSAKIGEPAIVKQ